jgi:hypothetical protein
VSPDLILRSRRVVTGGAVRAAAVHVTGGAITAVTEWNDVAPGAPLVDAGDDVIAIRDYDVNLVAHVLATEGASGATLVDRLVKGRTTIRSSADLGNAERENAADLADSLARNIVSLLAEGTW